MERNGPLVPQNVYIQAVLRELNAIPYDPAHHNGRRNPYSKKIIATKDDYEEYVREYVYYRLCDEILRRQYEAQLTQQTNELAKQSETRLILQNRQLEKRHQDEIDQINTRHSRTVIQLNTQHHNELVRARWRWPIIVLLLLAALYYTFFWHIPDIKSEARQNGEDSGYKSGYEAGLQEGRKSDVSRSNSSSSGSSSFRNTLSDNPTEPKSWVNPDRTVYVSRNNKIHLNSGCSGMQYFTIMTYGEACEMGCSHCRTCF